MEFIEYKDRGKELWDELWGKAEDGKVDPLVARGILLMAYKPFFDDQVKQFTKKKGLIKKNKNFHSFENRWEIIFTKRQPYDRRLLKRVRSVVFVDSKNIGDFVEMIENGRFDASDFSERMCLIDFSAPIK